MTITVDSLDIIRPVVGLLVGFLGRRYNFWSLDSLKGLGDVLFRFTKPAAFVQSILESTTVTVHWAMPLCICLYDIITLVGAWFLFSGVPWPDNVILTMGCTGLMGGALLPWAVSFFGEIGMTYYMYQEFYNVIHIFGTVFVFAFYFLKMKAPKKSENSITSDGSWTRSTIAKVPETWKGLFKEILLFPAVIVFIGSWPIYFILRACHEQVGETMSDIFTYLTSGFDFYLMVFLGGSLSISDIVRQSQNRNLWTAYFFRYVVAFPFFFMFYYDVFPDVNILTKNLMLMFMWLPVPAPFVFYVMLFIPNQDPSIITSLCALTQITQIMIYIIIGFVYFKDVGTTA